MDLSVYEPTKPEIPTKCDVQSSECKFAAKQENIAAAHIDHEENQQEQGETKPDYQQVQSQIQSQHSQTPSEAEDKQRQPTVELPAPPRGNMTGPAGGNSEPELLYASLQNNQMYSSGPSQASNQTQGKNFQLNYEETPETEAFHIDELSASSEETKKNKLYAFHGRAESSRPFQKGSKQLEAILASFQNNPIYSNQSSQQTAVSVPSASTNPNGPSQQTTRSTAVYVPSASTDPNGPSQQTTRSTAAYVPSASTDPNGPSQQTTRSTAVSVPSASANLKKGKTLSLWGRLKKCFS